MKSERDWYNRDENPKKNEDENLRKQKNGKGEKIDQQTKKGRELS